MLGALWASPAAAQWGRPSADDQARQFYEVGEQRYNEGAYEEAISQWLTAYQLSPRPLILFNMANAYERLGRYADALDNLERYRVEAPAEEHAQLDARLENLRQRVNGGGDGGGGGGGGMLIAGVIVASVGVAAIGAGIAFGVLALDARDQLQDPMSGACRDAGDRLVCGGDASSLFSDSETYALLADIFLIGGGVLAAGGLLLVVLDLASGGDDSQAAVQPRILIGPDGGSAGIVGRF